MATQTKKFTNIAVSTTRNNPTYSKSIVSPKTTKEVRCVMSSAKGTWANMLGSGILTMVVQQKLPNTTWINIIQSTFDARSTNSGDQALFSVLMQGLGKKNLRLVCWCTTPITLNATVTLTF